MAGPDESPSTLSALLTAEPILMYCNAVTALHNTLEEIAAGEADEQQARLMLPSKIRQLRNASRDLRSHLLQLESLAERNTEQQSDDIREHTQRIRRAIASIMQAGRGSFHVNGIPRQPTGPLSSNVNVNLVALSTIKASIHKLSEKIQKS